MSTAPLIAFWSVSKDSSSGEIVEMLSDGPSVLQSRFHVECLVASPLVTVLGGSRRAM